MSNNKKSLACEENKTNAVADVVDRINTHAANMAEIVATGEDVRAERVQLDVLFSDLNRAYAAVYA